MNVCDHFSSVSVSLTYTYEIVCQDKWKFLVVLWSSLMNSAHAIAPGTGQNLVVGLLASVYEAVGSGTSITKKKEGPTGYLSGWEVSLTSETPNSEEIVVMPNFLYIPIQF